MNKHDVFFSDLLILLRYLEWISLDVAGELPHRTCFSHFFPLSRVETCDEVPHNSSTPSPRNLQIWVGQLPGKEVYRVAVACCSEQSGREWIGKDEP